VFLGYWLINGGIQNFVQPKVMGEGVDLSPLVVFVSFLIWTYILGAVGAILAVPLTLFVKDLVLDSFDETQGLAYLISAGPKENPSGLAEGGDAG
jgi:predicted PurR-regulated permease PerM